MKIDMIKHKLTSQNISDYHKDGYVIVRSFYEAEEIAPLQQAVIDDPSINGSIYGMTGDTEAPQHFCNWTDCGDDMVGMMPRLTRTINATEALLNDECYHWHSKFVIKPPQCSVGRWHQDYGSWYDDGVINPDMLTIAKAITQTTRENGCTRVIPGSHRMGRMNPPQQIGAANAFRARLEHAKEKLGVVYCELNPGDVMFFHSNILHSGGANNTDTTRVVMFSSYNARANAPVSGASGLNEGGAFMNISKEERAFKRLERVSDDSLLARRYKSFFSHTNFASPKTGLDENFTRAVKLNI
jgi:ectoine hydroxylase